MYPRSMFWAKLRKMSHFSSENYHFYSREILHAWTCLRNELARSKHRWDQRYHRHVIDRSQIVHEPIGSRINSLFLFSSIAFFDSSGFVDFFYFARIPPVMWILEKVLPFEPCHV